MMADMSEPDDLLTTTEAGDILGVSGKTVSRYADLGTLAVIVLPSGHRRFRRSDIDALLAGTATGPVSGGAA